MGSRILIVDDNQEIREVVTVLLENEGYEVEEAGDGEAAIAKAEDMDLIILDVMMPKMDGFKACRQIREVTNAPILFLTAKTMDRLDFPAAEMIIWRSRFPIMNSLPV